jgi:uncharacterized damage-inducible protein DinB
MRVLFIENNMIARAYLQTMVDYIIWADRRILRIAQELPPSLLFAPQPIGFGTIFETLTHIMAGEQLWLRRWQGETNFRLPSFTFANLFELESHWAALHEELRTFIANQNFEQFNRLIHYTSVQGESYSHPLSLIFWHVINHGTDHRSELLAMLTLAGYKPDRVDMLFYLQTEKKHFAWVSDEG